MTDSPTDPERLAEPLTPLPCTDPDCPCNDEDDSATIDSLTTRLAAAETTLQKIIDHDRYDDFFATRIAREHLEAEHERP